jgi:hypothetical protein
MSTATENPPSRAQVQAEARPEIDRQRNDAEQQARQSIDREAAAAIEETRKALRAIADGRTDEAVAAIERATGKLDVLTSRNPAAALLPVDADAVIIDTAPEDLGAIRDLTDAVEAAMLVGDYPLARVVLAAMVSEIRFRTYRLPLATYPDALREAARLLDQRRTDEARALLEAALNTLVVVERIIPLPLVLARVAVNTAESLRDRDREAAAGLLAVARHELERAVELGYNRKEDEYKALSRAISDLEKQLRGNEDTTSGFAKLKDRIAAFFKRMTEGERTSQARSNARVGQDNRQNPRTSDTSQQQRQGTEPRKGAASRPA